MKQFIYNNNNYNYIENLNDPSVYGCILEIVINNEYNLDKFINIENSHFIDIGANCGIATIILAKQNPKSKIYSFEPDLDVFNFLKTNIEINSLYNVVLSNKAVCKSGVKEITLFKCPYFSGGNTTCSTNNDIKKYYNKEIDSYIVQCISIDEIIEHNNIDKIELLKIDCEGAEYEILYNSNYFKNNIVENIVGEFHNLSYNTTVKDTSNALINYCKKYVKNIINIKELTI